MSGKNAKAANSPGKGAEKSAGKAQGKATPQEQNTDPVVETPETDDDICLTGPVAGEKTFDYSFPGLTFSITLIQVGDDIQVQIHVTEGHMDVNALYWGNLDFSGASAPAPSAPLNMNGSASMFEGQPIQWDGAQKFSDPGLRGEGTAKSTYVGEGETITLPLLIEGVRIEDIDLLGIRATSSSNPEGSLKGVALNDDDCPPDDDDDNGDDPDPDCPTYDKVFFAWGFDGGTPTSGYAIFASDVPDEAAVSEWLQNPIRLDEGTEPTLDNFYAKLLELLENDPSFDPEDIEGIVVYELIMTEGGEYLFQPIETYGSVDDFPVPCLCAEDADTASTEDEGELEDHLF